MKECPKCHNIKELSEYSPDKSKKDGRTSYCKSCRRELCNKYWLNNKEKATKATRKWQDEHRKRCAENKKLWKSANPELVKEQYQRWFEKDPDKVKLMFRGYASRRRTTIKGNLNNRIGPAMGRSLREGKDGRSWEDLVGYTVEQLRRHIEKHFLPGMSWDNKSKWHIDHKTPTSAFNFDTPDDVDFKKCWALNNLQPLWKLDNISKKDRLSRPHQPSLLIAMGG